MFSQPMGVRQELAAPEHPVVQLTQTSSSKDRHRRAAQQLRMRWQRRNGLATQAAISPMGNTDWAWWHAASPPGVSSTSTLGSPFTR